MVALLGEFMPFFSLPWVFGPVPIVATVWSAYVTVATIAHRRGMTGGRFLAAFLLPLGVISAASLLFLTSNVRIVLVAGHIATTICFIIIYISEKMRSGEPCMVAAKENSRSSMFWSLYFLLVIYIFYHLFIFIFPISSGCTIAKCYLLEILFGGKVYGFSVFYFANFAGSVILSLVTLVTAQLVWKIKSQD